VQYRSSICFRCSAQRILKKVSAHCSRTGQSRRRAHTRKRRLLSRSSGPSSPERNPSCGRAVGPPPSPERNVRSPARQGRGPSLCCLIAGFDRTQRPAVIGRPGQFVSKNFPNCEVHHTAGQPSCASFKKNRFGSRGGLNLESGGYRCDSPATEHTD